MCTLCKRTRRGVPEWGLSCLSCIGGSGSARSLPTSCKSNSGQGWEHSSVGRELPLCAQSPGSNPSTAKKKKARVGTEVDTWPAKQHRTQRLCLESLKTGWLQGISSQEPSTCWLQALLQGWLHSLGLALGADAEAGNSPIWPRPESGH